MQVGSDVGAVKQDVSAFKEEMHLYKVGRGLPWFKWSVIEYGLRSVTCHRRKEASRSNLILGDEILSYTRSFGRVLLG